MAAVLPKLIKSLTFCSTYERELEQNNITYNKMSLFVKWNILKKILLLLLNYMWFMFTKDMTSRNTTQFLWWLGLFMLGIIFFDEASKKVISGGLKNKWLFVFIRKKPPTKTSIASQLKNDKTYAWSVVYNKNLLFVNPKNKIILLILISQLLFLKNLMFFCFFIILKYN